MAKRLIYLIVLMMTTFAVLLSFAGGSASGQTPSGTSAPTPTAGTTPTVTTTPSVPSGQDLLTAMQAAVTAKNSFHQVSSVDIVIPKHESETEHLQGDASNKPLLERITGKIHTALLDTKPQKSTTQNEEIRVARSKVALRLGKAAWQCMSVAQLTQGAGQVVSSVLGSEKVASVENLGADTMNGIPVWHVHAVVTFSLNGTDQSIAADYYIAQSDYTLVHEGANASLVVSGTTVTEKIADDYTKYGEPVKVKLPAACAAKAAPSGRTSRPLTTVTNPLSLIRAFVAARFIANPNAPPAAALILASQ